MSDACLAPGLTLPEHACAALCRDLPRAGGFDQAMRVVEGVRQRLLGEGLLTINLDATPVGADAEVIELRRIWSSRPDAYPVSGRKRKTMTAWTRQLLRRSEIFVGEGEAALAEVFDDSTLILAMGLKAVVNVPLVRPDGRCFATFNVLGTQPRWAPEQVLLIELLAAFALPVLVQQIEQPAEEAAEHHDRVP